MSGSGRKTAIVWFKNSISFSHKSSGAVTRLNKFVFQTVVNSIITRTYGTAPWNAATICRITTERIEMKCPGFICLHCHSNRPRVCAWIKGPPAGWWPTSGPIDACIYFCRFLECKNRDVHICTLNLICAEVPRLELDSVQNEEFRFLCYTAFLPALLLAVKSKL
jgi:hypothetical protein